MANYFRVLNLFPWRRQAVMIPLLPRRIFVSAAVLDAEKRGLTKTVGHSSAVA
jgi:hypothetical protein